MQSSLDRVLEQRLVERQSAGLLRSIAPERGLLDFASNDYLGLRSHPVQLFAHGAGASRLVTGTHEVHELLEADLARWVGCAAALTFSSGFAANVSVLPALVGSGDLVVSDSLNHASIVDGCRLSRATVRVFPHRDLEAARAILQAERGRCQRALLVTESVFSMDGDLADLGALRTLTAEYDAWLMVDEAHALGVFGAAGAGRCFAAGIVPEVLVGTFGKAVGYAGAFVAGSAPLRQWLIQAARGFVFSTALPLDQAEVLRARVAMVQEAHSERAALWDRVASWGAAVGSPCPSPIVPVRCAAPVATAERLRAHGLRVAAIRYPTVPRGAERLRVVLRADHSESDCEALRNLLRQERVL